MNPTRKLDWEGSSARGVDAVADEEGKGLRDGGKGGEERVRGEMGRPSDAVGEVFAPECGEEGGTSVERNRCARARREMRRGTSLED